MSRRPSDQGSALPRIHTPNPPSTDFDNALSRQGVDTWASSGGHLSSKHSHSGQLGEHLEENHMNHEAAQQRTLVWVEEVQKDRIGASAENSPTTTSVNLVASQEESSHEQAWPHVEELLDKLGGPFPCQDCIRNSGRDTDSGYHSYGSYGSSECKKKLAHRVNRVNKFIEKYPDAVEKIRNEPFDEAYGFGGISPTQSSSDSQFDDLASSVPDLNLDARSEKADSKPRDDLRRIIKEVMLIRRALLVWKSSCTHNKCRDRLSVPSQHMPMPTVRLGGRTDVKTSPLESRIFESSQEGIESITVTPMDLDPKNDPSPSSKQKDVTPKVRPKLRITLPDGRISNISEDAPKLITPMPKPQCDSPHHLSTFTQHSFMAISPSTASDYSRTVTDYDIDSDDEVSVEEGWISVRRERTSFHAKVMKAVKSVIEQGGPDISQMITTAADGNQDEAGPSNYMSQLNQGGEPSSSKRRARDKGKKREHRRSGDDTDDEDGSGQKRPRHDASEKTPTFAFRCPYFKKYPERQHKKSCETLKRSTARLKEHLHREHLKPFYCGRCWELFGDDDEALAQHSQGGCQQIEQPAHLFLDGISREKRKKLKSRKEVWGGSELEKWRSIWLIVFPRDSSVPDPELAFRSPDEQVLELFNSFNKDNLPAVLADDLDECLQDVLRELWPTIFQYSLIETVREKFKKRIKGKTEENLSTMFKLFKGSTNIKQAQQQLKATPQYSEGEDATSDMAESPAPDEIQAEPVSALSGLDSFGHEPEESWIPSYEVSPSQNRVAELCVEPQRLSLSLHTRPPFSQNVSSLEVENWMPVAQVASPLEDMSIIQNPGLPSGFTSLSSPAPTSGNGQVYSGQGLSMQPAVSSFGISEPYQAEILQTAPDPSRFTDNSMTGVQIDPQAFYPPQSNVDVQRAGISYAVDQGGQSYLSPGSQPTSSSNFSPQAPVRYQSVSPTSNRGQSHVSMAGFPHQRHLASGSNGVRPAAGNNGQWNGHGHQSRHNGRNDPYGQF